MNAQLDVRWDIHPEKFNHIQIKKIMGNFILSINIIIKVAFNILFVQKALVYPGSHPLLQYPVYLLQGEASKQWPLQLLMQSNPNDPSGQTGITVYVSFWKHERIIFIFTHVSIHKLRRHNL